MSCSRVNLTSDSQNKAAVLVHLYFTCYWAPQSHSNYHPEVVLIGYAMMFLANINIPTNSLTLAENRIMCTIRAWMWTQKVNFDHVILAFIICGLMHLILMLHTNHFRLSVDLLVWGQCLLVTDVYCVPPHTHTHTHEQRVFLLP